MSMRSTLPVRAMSFRGERGELPEPKNFSVTRTGVKSFL